MVDFPFARAHASLTPNARGALWMLGSAVCFVAMALCLKALAARGFSESQMVLARCLSGFVILVPFVMARPRALIMARPVAVLSRGVLSTLGFFGTFYAMSELPLADAQAYSFTRPLFVVLLAAWLLKERVAWRRWAAVGVGFAGVVVMLDPGAVELSLPGLVALGAALVFALSIVTAKDLTRDHSVTTTVLYTNLIAAVLGLPFAFGQWTAPDLSEWLLLAALGFTGVAAQSCYVRALSEGDASLVGLVDYTRLPIAAAAAYLAFGEVPTTRAVLGGAVIAAATLYVTWRESTIGVPPKKDEIGAG